ncbi:hypothetical protein [Bacillus mycoides]|uniref:hypothetical protein n=1 Tax=Bacillus mycoides TaxID=1405 RepID=UPI002E225DFB|nr:hypothetical protein [Bacillus mycoides]
MESRHEKFRRIAENRLSRVFSTMSLIENLANKRYYDYTIDEVQELFGAYKEKGIEIREYFEATAEKKELTRNFTFKTDNKIRNEKNDKFREIAQSRLSKVFSDMNLLANLSNKSNYTYHEVEIEEMFEAFIEKGIETKGRFIVRNEFKFSS